MADEGPAERPINEGDDAAAEEDRPEDFPGVDVAFDFVRPAYEWAARRLEAQDNRIQTLLTFSPTATIAVVAFARSVRDLSLTSPWLVAALVVMGVTVILGLFARLRGRLIFYDLYVLYEQWLSVQPWEFKKNMIYFAGDHFAENEGVINRKAWLADVMSFLLFIEVLFLTVWAMMP